MEPNVKSVITIAGTPYSKELYEAAPDMCDALKSVDLWMDEAGLPKDTMLRRNIKQALAKAEGRSEQP